MAAPATILADLTALRPAFDVTRYPIGGSAPVDAVTPGIAGSDLEAERRVLAWTKAQL